MYDHFQRYQPGGRPGAVFVRHVHHGHGAGEIRRRQDGEHPAEAHFVHLARVALGAVITALIQSSSGTTVIVVGLVNSGIMQLSQAIGIIMAPTSAPR